MRKYFKTIVFIIGVDVLGFPNFQRHHLKFGEDSQFFKAYSKN